MPSWLVATIILLSALVIFQPWNLGWRELMRQEGLYAAIAQEYSVFNHGVVVAHGAVIRNAYPVYPLLVQMVAAIFKLPMEMALRIVSLVMAACCGLMVYVAAASNRTGKAGFVAISMYIGTTLILEKASDGFPATTTAAALLAGQLLLFQFGYRKTNWSMAWIIGFSLMTIGFFSGGPAALLYFVFPMFFLRRPLSVRSKFTKPGFAVGVVLFLLPVLWWAITSWNFHHRLAAIFLGNENDTLLHYLRDVLTAPAELPIRLFPWCLIAWLPFCVALQALDTTPIFSRYLRTLTIANLFLYWLLPSRDPRELIYVLGPLSILTGINYELGMRRYGERIRKFLLPGGWLILVLIGAIFALCLLPPELLSYFVSITLSVDFSRQTGYRIVAGGAVLLLLFLWTVLRRGRKTLPVWLCLLILSTASGSFYWTVIQPYRAQERDRCRMGSMLAEKLRQEPCRKLYKHQIVGLYSELFYCGKPVRQIKELEALENDRSSEIYLLSTEFPQVAEREWHNLLPSGYTYCGNPLALWKGTLRSGK